MPAPDTLWPALILYCRSALERAGISGHATARFVQADRPGWKVQEPMVTMRALSWANHLGLTADKRLDDVFSMRHREQGTLSLQGYGVATAEWLAAIRRHLDDDVATAPLAAAGFDLGQLSGIINLSAVLDTSIEARYSLDLSVDYIAESDDLTADVVHETRVSLSAGEPALSSTIVNVLVEPPPPDPEP